jgi:hypothetical protein
MPNNRMHLRATDKKGKVLFDGDIHTKEEREALSPELKEKVGQMLDFDDTGKPRLSPKTPKAK